jgi:four helix bundle protein
MEKSREYRGYKDLKVYQASYQVALEIHRVTKGFPFEEKYSLTDQVRRSSRSVAATLAEAWKKRRYQKAFISKLVDCAGEAAETEVWLDFALDFGYLEPAQHDAFMSKYDQINRMLFGMIDKADKFQG